MKLGNTDRGTGIVCENKVELSMVLSAIGDLLDLDFWMKAEEECVTMVIGGTPVYLTHIFDEVKKESISAYEVEAILESKERSHKSPRYIVYSFDVDPRAVINNVISSAKTVSQKKPYKI